MKENGKIILTMDMVFIDSMMALNIKANGKKELSMALENLLILGKRNIMAFLSNTIVGGSLLDINCLYADTLAGNGSELTALNASNISSGTLAKERLATSGATAGSYGPSADVSGTNGTTMSVPYITVDTYGRVTSISN